MVFARAVRDTRSKPYDEPLSAGYAVQQQVKDVVRARVIEWARLPAHLTAQLAGAHGHLACFHEERDLCSQKSVNAGSGPVCPTSSTPPSTPKT